MTKTLTEIWSVEEKRQFQRTKLKKVYENAELRKTIGEKVKVALSDPKVKLQRSNSMKQVWQNENTNSKLKNRKLGKLSKGQVDTIRSKYITSTFKTMKAFVQFNAIEYNVSNKTIYRIIKNFTWKE